MKKLTIVVPFIAASLTRILIGAQSGNLSLSAEKILRAAENVRNPAENYKVGVILKENDDVRTYGTFVKTRSKTLVQFLTPIADRGTQVLMVDNQMWIYMPKVANPVRISPRQRLSGNAVYGDIARLDFVENYSPTLNRVDLAEKQKVYVLDLKAIEGKAVTYDHIEYWIFADSYRPYKALFKTSSGKVLREAYYKEFRNVFGLPRPTKVLFVDYLDQKHVTVLLLRNYKRHSLPDLAFDKMNLDRSMASFR